jgi:nucleoside phosphorylase
MITIYCAIYQEAQELIRAYQLKKETMQKHFQVFSKEDTGIRVVITGVGSVAAATAVAELSTCYPPESSDVLLNFGSCAAGEDDAVGAVYLGHKITEECSGRTFYPDVLYRHPFAEEQIVSLAAVASGEDLLKRDGLYDMESAAIYQAGNYYYSPHQMIFIKVVSDHGMSRQRNARESSQVNDFVETMAKASPQVYSFVNTLRDISNQQRESVKNQRAIKLQTAEEAEVLTAALHCSVTMQAELTQLLFYCRLTGMEYDKIFEEYTRQGRLPAKDKREGKKLLEELRARVL